MIENRMHSVLEDNLRKIFKRKIEIYRMKVASWGYVYHLWVNRNKYLMKVGIDEFDGTGIKNEFKALKMLQAKGINNVPVVEHFGKIEKQYFLVEKFIEKTETADIYNLGEVFARIHKIKDRTSKYYDIFAKDILNSLLIRLRNIRYIQQEHVSKLYVDTLDHIESNLNRIREIIDSNKKWFYAKNGVSFMNMDNNDSIISHNKNIYIVDWHLACFGDFVWDIARLFYYYKFRKDIFLKGYLKSMGGEEADSLFQRLKIYELLNVIFNVLFYYEDELHLMLYSNVVLIRQDSRKLNFAVKLLNKKIIRRIDAVGIKLNEGFR